MNRFLLTTALILATSSHAPAGAIESACMQSGRKAASRSLCGCVQDVADLTLDRSDQRKAAKFFRDPQQAQDVRMSKRAADDAFWDRYTSFGEAAQVFCKNS